MYYYSIIVIASDNKHGSSHIWRFHGVLILEVYARIARVLILTISDRLCTLGSHGVLVNNSLGETL